MREDDDEPWLMPPAPGGRMARRRQRRRLLGAWLLLGSLMLLVVVALAPAAMAIEPPGPDVELVSDDPVGSSPAGEPAAEAIEAEPLDTTGEDAAATAAPEAQGDDAPSAEAATGGSESVEADAEAALDQLADSDGFTGVEGFLRLRTQLAGTTGTDGAVTAAAPKDADQGAAAPLLPLPVLGSSERPRSGTVRLAPGLGEHPDQTGPATLAQQDQAGAEPASPQPDVWSPGAPPPGEGAALVATPPAPAGQLPAGLKTGEEPPLPSPLHSLREAVEREWAAGTLDDRTIAMVASMTSGTNPVPSPPPPAESLSMAILTVFSCGFKVLAAHLATLAVMKASPQLGAGAVVAFAGAVMADEIRVQDAWARDGRTYGPATAAVEGQLNGEWILGALTPFGLLAYELGPIAGPIVHTVVLVGAPTLGHYGGEYVALHWWAAGQHTP